MIKRQPVVDMMTTVITRRPVLTRSEQTLFDGTNHTYRIMPDLVNVDFLSCIVLIQGVQMDEDKYSINFYKGLITIHTDISPLIDDIEIRFRPDPNKYHLYREMLILPVSDLIPVDDLIHYTPAFFDIIGIPRIIQYPHNAWSRNQLHKAQWGHVMDYRIENTGIIAALKVYE